MMRVAVMAQTRVALGLLAVACGLLQADAFAIGPARLSLGASNQRCGDTAFCAELATGAR